MSKQDYTPYNIYQKRKMAEKTKTATPLKSIYAQNSNMFLNSVPTLRNGLQSGFDAEGGDKKRPLPIIDKSKKKDDKNDESKNLTVNMTGTGTTNTDTE
jgi:hypothetical protein